MRNPFVFGRDPWDPSHRFVTSWLLSPLLLAVVRAVFSIYIFVQLLFIIIWNCAHADRGGCRASRDEFSYFTVLTDWGIAFYLAVAAVHTAVYARYGQPLLDGLPRPMQALHNLLYTSITVLPFIVTAVYWGKLYDGPWFVHAFDAWQNVSQHALNSAFALFEILVPRTEPAPWLHVLWLLVILALYLALAYLTRLTKGYYVYSFLDPAQAGGSGLVAAYIFGIAAGCLVVFAIVRGLVWLRLWIVEKKLGKTGKLAPRDRRDNTPVELLPQVKV